jgi:hypothetical protein
MASAGLRRTLVWGTRFAAPIGVGHDARHEQAPDVFLVHLATGYGLRSPFDNGMVLVQVYSVGPACFD